MLTNDALMRALVRAAQTRSPSAAFERLLEKEINIDAGIRAIAGDSQRHLREFLSAEHGRDATFPRILSKNDDDFLGGSFARHVKNWPLDDIDVYLPLDGHNLVYHSYGTRLPYTVVSDGVLTHNPLLQPRWMGGADISSAKLINEFSNVLRRHYPEQTEVLPNGEAVTVRMRKGETGSGDGLGFDVVPCFSLIPDDRLEQPFYLIPDGTGSWIRTNPRLDQAVSERLHEANEKTFRKAVKILKYWNTAHLGGVLSSYYIELAIARAFLDRNSRGEHVRTLSYAVAIAFEALNAAVVAGNQKSWIAHAPEVTPGDLTPTRRVQVLVATIQAQDAWKNENAGRNEDAIRSWQSIFGSGFSPLA